MPLPASCAANTADREALAAAQPFHIESSPVRVTPNGRWGDIAREIAFPVCSRSSPITFAAPQTAPMTLKMPWSQPKSLATTSSDKRQNTS